MRECKGRGGPCDCCGPQGERGPRVDCVRVSVLLQHIKDLHSPASGYKVCGECGTNNGECNTQRLIRKAGE